MQFLTLRHAAPACARRAFLLTEFRISGFVPRAFCGPSAWRIKQFAEGAPLRPRTYSSPRTYWTLKLRLKPEKGLFVKDCGARPERNALVVHLGELSSARLVVSPSGRAPRKLMEKHNGR